MRKKFDSHSDRLWFTSDIHFGHESMIEKCRRPFKDVDAMDEHIITTWNRMVGERDHVFILGDFSFRSRNSFPFRYTDSVIHPLLW